MIGNYIRDIWSENGFFKVTELRKDKVFYGNCFKAQYKDIQPIPLTEEMLLKFPVFHKSRNQFGTTFHIMEDECDYIVKHTIEHWTETDNPKYKDRFHWVGIGKIEFLHELQNLYKALTKNDLTI